MQQQSQQHPGMFSSKCIQTEMTVGDIRTLESHSSHEMESRESKIEELQQVGESENPFSGHFCYKLARKLTIFLFLQQKISYTLLTKTTKN